MRSSRVPPKLAGEGSSATLSLDEMTGAEFRDIRKGLGLTVVEFGRAIGYAGDNNSASTTIRAYEGDRKPVPPWIARLAFMYSRFGIPDDIS